MKRTRGKVRKVMPRVETRAGASAAKAAEMNHRQKAANEAVRRAGGATRRCPLIQVIVEFQEERVDKDMNAVEEEALIMETRTKMRAIIMMRRTSFWMKRRPTLCHLESNTSAT